MSAPLAQRLTLPYFNLDSNKPQNRVMGKKREEEEREKRRRGEKERREEISRGMPPRLDWDFSASAIAQAGLDIF